MTVLLIVATQCNECGKTSPARVTDAPDDIETTPPGWAFLSGAHYCSYACALAADTNYAAARVAVKFAGDKK